MATGRGRGAKRRQAGKPAGRSAPVAERRFSRADALAATVLALLAVGCYVPAFSAGFVWDDRIFTESRAVRDWSGLWSIWFSLSAIENEVHYWPLVYTSFWLEHKLWGFSPAGYHAVNVGLHAANTLLLWRLLGRVGAPGAWAVAAVFAVHPLHVESVAWIMERKDTLSGFFYLTAFLAWSRFAEDPERGGKHYALALAMFVLGILSKSIVVTLPAALLIFHWWKRGRVAGVDLRRLAPFFAVALFAALADTALAHAREPVSFDYTTVERALIAARALWFYAVKLLWPVDLAVIYPYWPVSVRDPVGQACLVGAAALAAALWLARRRIGRGPLAGALFFAVTLSPVLGFVDHTYMGFSFVADRYQYLAGVGLTAVIVGAAAHGAARLPGGWRKGAAGAAAAVLLMLGTLTWRQAEVYRNEATLFAHVIAHNPNAREAHLNLGKGLVDSSRLEEALAAFRIAAEKTPDDPRGHANIGGVLIMLERMDEAEEPLRRALEADPRSVYGLQNLAAAMVMWERYDEALDLYRRLAEVDPRNPSAHHGVGTALYFLGRLEESLAALERALALNPARDDIRTNRDQVLAALERREQ